jgi:hypothetical protein
MNVSRAKSDKPYGDRDKPHRRRIAHYRSYAGFEEIAKCKTQTQTEKQKNQTELRQPG